MYNTVERYIGSNKRRTIRRKPYIIKRTTGQKRLLMDLMMFLTNPKMFLMMAQLTSLLIHTHIYSRYH